MLLAIILDAFFACFTAVLIIYALVFSVHCIFVSDCGKRFSFEDTLKKIEDYSRGEDKCQKNQ